MDKLNRCIESLDRTGIDVLDIGCRWQERSPATLAESADSVAGLLIMLASGMLLYVLNELARNYFKPPSN